MTLKLTLTLLPESFAICRLDPDAPIPEWAYSQPFCSITRTADELSIVCKESNSPSGIKCEKDFSCLKIEGKLDFSEIGILASLTTTLANASVSIFAISTYDTDYLLVKQRDLKNAMQVLQQAGHQIQLPISNLQHPTSREQ